ncbi:hypothetical protein EDD86DRAFT_215761 [Gorgonomyces haynaldii]|nr:hypothetical protein EDD86DRAFT_215761 [Gorgonomyces haynaldii]
MAHICRTTMVSNLRSIQYVDIASMTDSDAQAYLRTSLIMELLANVTGSFALTGFVNAMVKTATAADLFQPFVFRDRIIDPKTPLLVYRITVLLIVIVTSSLLCTIGITRSYSEYLLYRRVFYGMFTIISFCCSMPLAAFFGLKVFTAFLKMPDAQELSVTINTVTGSQVSPASDNSQSRPNRIWIPSPTNNSKKSKLFTLRLSIYGVVLMYGFAGAYLSSVIWINETFSHDHRSLLYAKIVLDAFLFIYYSWYTGSCGLEWMARSVSCLIKACQPFNTVVAPMAAVGLLCSRFLLMYIGIEPDVKLSRALDEFTERENEQPMILTCADQVSVRALLDHEVVVMEKEALEQLEEIYACQ